MENVHIFCSLLVCVCVKCSIPALMTDLYLDWATFKGLAVQDNVSKLVAMLDHCDLPSLIKFFEVAP